MAQTIIKICLFLAAAIGASAQITWTISPNPCVIKGNTRWFQGAACVVTISGTGNWNAIDSGGLANQYFPSAHVCRVQPDHSCANVGSGTGPAELRIYNNYDNPISINPGVYSRIVAINGVQIPVTINLLPATANIVIGDYNRHSNAQLIALGCYDSTAGIGHVTACPDTNPRPGGAYNLPAVGSGAKEPIFGTPFYTIAADHHAYAEFPYTSASDGVMITQNLGNVATQGNSLHNAGTSLWTPSCSGPWDAYTNPTKLAQNNLTEETYRCTDNVTNPPTIKRMTQAGTTTIFTAPGGQKCLTSRMTTADGYVLVWGNVSTNDCANEGNAATWHYLYLVNEFPPYNYYTIDLTDPRIPYAFSVRTFRVIGPDRAGTYYLFLSLQPNALWLYLHADGTWGLVGRIPDFVTGNWKGFVQSDCLTFGFGCFGGGHATDWTSNGTVGLVTETGVDSLAGGIVNVQPSLLPNSAPPITNGGLTNWFFTQQGDYQTGAKTLPLVATSTSFTGTAQFPSNNPVPITAVTSTTVTLASNIGATTSGANSHLLIGCETDQSGGTDIHGSWVVTNVSVGPPYILTLSGFSWSGTYNNYCAAMLDLATPAGSNDGAVTYLARLDQMGKFFQGFYIAKNRSYAYTCCLLEGATDYYSAPFTQLTQNGKYVIISTNNGEPNRHRVLSFQSPWQMLTPNANELAPSYPIDITPGGGGSLNIRARVPDGVALSCTFSTAIDLTTNASTISLPGPYIERTASFFGAPRIPYYWICSSTDNYYAATGVTTTI